jgi:hypothetical protein
VNRAPLPRPLARLDVAAFVDLVREVRTLQIADLAASGATFSTEARTVAGHLDEWLCELGYPPLLPIEFDEAALEAAAADDES